MFARCKWANFVRMAGARRRQGRQRETILIGTKVLNKVFGTSNERAVKRMLPRVGEINAFEPAVKAMSDEELRAKTVEFRARIAAALEGIEDEEARVAAEKQALDELLPEAFAVVREAGWRAVNMRHFDVQLVGGMVLQIGRASCRERV